LEGRIDGGDMVVRTVKEQREERERECKRVVKVKCE